MLLHKKRNAKIRMPCMKITRFRYEIIPECLNKSMPEEWYNLTINVQARYYVPVVDWDF